ncbi:molybdate transporter subunit; periplasmic-binding component of ABC superfamily protein [Beijerinckiaceae bacterium RH AL1]|nr:molybdate transporter subunit; periplasmic-binding component of ABC superfamily protein [Beijerinckiaceae bacterium RH CH11]VVB49934.1 molybdate transporter subunit; periplasmic-binding component of ABC superfamily protein [Beijerinckiaceae bacterium RH AL8]VVC57112.1 molybdate transporter subunit; periplasmic-binding component of ABC superfamily protein [Beijerinckiaceae bacterium RH AL1]
MVRLGSLLLAAALVVAPGLAHADANGPTVFAAASMKTALDAMVAAWKAKTGKTVVVSYGSSGTLAKQIEAGAPADLFISADQKWMDVLAKDGAIRPDTRVDLLGNSLVLVAAAVTTKPMTIEKGFDLAGALGDGKLAVCTVSSCPAGIYGKEALTKLGVWSAVEPKIAQADNVRAALLLVSRGEAKYGIVYGTDAKAEPKVKVVGTFPESSHAPIVYPVAVTKDARSPDAAALESYLRSPEAKAILEGQGFTVLAR